MESVEKLEADQESLQQEGHTVLKDGIDVHQLLSGEPIMFEVDADRSTAMPASNMFKGEELYNHISHFGWEEDSESSEGEGASPFEIQARKMTNVTDDGGVKKRLLHEGTGPLVPEGALVRLHYNGYLEYADEPYDSTRLRNKQCQVKLGQSGFLPGLELAVATMRRGELSRFLIAPEYAFGPRGCPPRIPENSTVMFEVEMMSFVDYKGADEFASFPEEERKQASFDQLLEVASAEKALGNDYFEQKMYPKAITRYNKAVKLLEDIHLQNEKEEDLWKQALVKLYLNLSLCFLKQKKAERAAGLCRKALDLDQNSVKAHYRLGQAHLLLSDFDRSRTHLLKAARLAPGNTEIREELQRLERSIQKFKAIEKEVSTLMFQDSKSSQESRKAEGSGRVTTHQQFPSQSDMPSAESNPFPPDHIAKDDVSRVKGTAERFNLQGTDIPSGVKVYQGATQEGNHPS